MEKKLICSDCNMVFRSARLLEKHKALFCIGRAGGDLRVQRRSSDIVMRNKGEGIDPKQMRTPDLVQTRGRRRIITGWRSAETEPASRTREDEPHKAALQNLTDEFHKLRMSIEEHLSTWSNRTTGTEASGRQLGQSERLKQMREMATLHERQLALIRVQHQQLEQQRDELAHQVSILSEQSNKPHLESLLMELREQEERNDETLQQLSEHLQALHVQQVSVPAAQPELHKKTKMHHENVKLISSVDGPISTQIKALRHAYMQSGGSDPAIVAQMIDLQAEAQSLEKNPAAAAAASKAKKKKVKPPQQDPFWELLAVEQENQRLEEEILRIQLARNRHHSYEAAARTELELIQRENQQQRISLQAEMERSKEALTHSRQHPAPPHPVPLQTQTRSHAHLSLLHTRSFSSPLGIPIMEPLDSLGPTPYDPEAGFMVFFDLVTGVDPYQKVLRLVAALYSEGHEVGPPTPTPPVQCQLGESYHHSPGNYALLSVKQAVPRIQPSPSLCLVVEVQAAKYLDVYNQEVFKLVACGWTQLELFDQYNQLHSGYWRVPVRRLPIRPLLSLPQLNSIPQVGNMELCVRLVNGRDGDAQTVVKPDPTSTHHYKYPAVVSSLSIPGNTALPLLDPQLTEKDQLSSLLPVIDHKDPTPTHEASHS